MTEERSLVFPDLEALSAATAKELARLASHAITTHGHFTLALSGGSTPRKLYEIVARDYRDTIDWLHVYLFWTDERYVPQDDANSNYRLVKESLLDRISIPSKNVLPIPTSFVDPKQSAQAYAKDIATVFGETTPEFDLILLGLGPDGHVASLFPTTDFEGDRDKLVTVTEANVAPFVTRISLTMPLIDGAKNVWFLVSGKEKAGILSEVFESRKVGDEKFPASRVNPIGNLRWFVDKSATSSLPVAFAD